MIDPGHPRLSIVRQCELASISRSPFYRGPTAQNGETRISMDGRGRWMDNVFIERLWRSLKYECVYLNAFETGSEARTGDRSLGCLLQLDIRRQDDRRSPGYAGNRGETSGVIQPRTNLSQAAILSRKADHLCDLWGDGRGRPWR